MHQIFLIYFILKNIEEFFQPVLEILRIKEKEKREKAFVSIIILYFLLLLLIWALY